MKKVVRRGLPYMHMGYLLIIVIITTVFGALTTIGVSAEVGDTFTANTSGGCPITYRVTSEGAFPEVEVYGVNKDYNGGIILPESIINPNNNVQYSITGIKGSVFNNCKSLTSIVMPDVVTSIESNAFNSCKKLETVILSDKLETIPDFCFRYCDSLTTVTTSSNLDDKGNPKVSGVYLPNVAEVARYAFDCCPNIEKVTLPACTTVGDRAFSCPTYSNLVSVSLPVCTSIGQYAFEGCNNIKILELPSYTNLKSREFSSLKSLEKVILNDNISSIPDQCFDQCIALTTVTTPSNLDDKGNPKVSGVCLPNVKEVAKYAFFYCPNIEKVTLPACTTVGDRAFSCPTYMKLVSSLTNVSLSVCTSIGQYAFEGCISLTYITLKEGSSIGRDAFLGVPADMDIKYVMEIKYV